MIKKGLIRKYRDQTNVLNFKTINIGMRFNR